MSSSAASHILFKNKTHILSLWVITSEKLNTADVSKIYTSIPVQLAKPPNYYVDEMMRLFFFFNFSWVKFFGDSLSFTTKVW